MEDLLIKSYDAAQSATIPIEAVNAVLSGGANVAEDNEQTEEEASSTTPPENEEADDAEPKYNVGDYVRCTYTDGVDYEAKIIKINYNNQTCRIRYIGYENEETVKWDALIATWGEEVRNAQNERVKAECTQTTADSTEVSSKKKTKKTPFGFNPPPVPPIPPMLFDSGDEEQNQQFAQLLISWFMTGYYTGLHQRTMQTSKK